MHCPTPSHQCDREQCRRKEIPTGAPTRAVAVPSSHLCSTAEVVIVNLFNGLEVDNTLQLCLMFICPREGTVVDRR